MKLLNYLLVVIVLSIFTTAVSADVLNFGDSSGNSGYHGVVVIGDDGSVALTVAAVQDGTVTSTMTTTDTGGASVDQTNVAASGEAIFVASGAANTGAQAAGTNVQAYGTDATPATVTSAGQGASADTSGAGAGQTATVATGTSASVGTGAGLVDNSNVGAGSIASEVSETGGVTSVAVGSQDAGISNTHVGAGQDAVTVSGGSGTIATDVSTSTTAASASLVTVGTATVSDQGAGAGNSGGGAGQTIVSATGSSTAESSASSNGNSASATMTETKGALAGDQHAGAGYNGAGADQEGTVSGHTAGMTVAVSNDNGNGESASTSTTVTYDGTTHAVISGEQGGSTNNNHAGAGQEVNAAGQTISAVSQASGDVAGAYASADVTAGTLALTHQGAGASNHGAGASQAALASGSDVALTSSAGNTEGASVTTGAGITEGVVQVLDQDVHAGYDNADGSQQVMVTNVGITANSDGYATTSVVDEHGNMAFTTDSFSGYGLISTAQNGVADSAYVTQQSTVAVAYGSGTAMSGAMSHQGDVATTTATVDNGGVIQTGQAAGAGYVHAGSSTANGAAAGQLSTILATNGGSATSSASNANNDEGAAGTNAIVFGQGKITTAQGAAAGQAAAWQAGLFGIHADGAVAAQYSTLNSTNGGFANSWSNNEDQNYAQTGVGYDGVGKITDTIQGAAAGEVRAHDNTGDNINAEGALALQHTESVTSDTGAYVSSDSSSMDPAAAHTTANFAGIGAITDATSGAAAGNVDATISGNDVTVDGALAAQHIGDMHSTNGGHTMSSAAQPDNEEGSASTQADYNDVGSIEGNTQGAAAGTAQFQVNGNDVWLNGAVAGQHTNEITSTTFGGARTAANNEDELTAVTGTSFQNTGQAAPGTITGTTQFGVAGQVAVNGQWDTAEGAAVFQSTDGIQSNNGGHATSESNNIVDSQTAMTEARYATNGAITGTTQGAAAGGIWLPDGDMISGAVAMQHTNEIQDEHFGIARSSATDNKDGHFDEGFATTSARFWGEGNITGTTQGAIAGETTNDYFSAEGAAAIQHTDEIQSLGGARISSYANNEFDNQAAARTTFYGTNEVYGNMKDATSGAVAGWIDDGTDYTEGAAAGQYVDSIELGTGKSATMSVFADSPYGPPSVNVQHYTGSGVTINPGFFQIGAGGYYVTPTTVDQGAFAHRITVP